jgi:hypothetical protein
MSDGTTVKVGAKRSRPLPLPHGRRGARVKRAGVRVTLLCLLLVSVVRPIGHCLLVDGRDR